jgi:peptidoglycan/xylan/chitin deacetylase (PgdA/CDA1 family)
MKKILIVLLLLLIGTGLMAGEKRFILTVDDGPNKYTKPILDHFENKGYYCVWFVSGSSNRFRPYHKTFKRIINMGHMLGNHSRSHNLKLFRTGSYDTIYRDIKSVQDYFIDKFGYKMTLFRPPFGIQREAVLPKVLSELNLKNYLWILDVGDCGRWKVFNETEVDKIIRSYLNWYPKLDEIVVILHSNRNTSPNIKAITKLLEKYGSIVKTQDVRRYAWYAK